MLTKRQLDVLSQLFLTRDSWVTPMWIGGRDGSHHSQTLRQLVKRGLVERLKSHAIYCMHGTHYVIDKRGRTVRTKKPIERCICKGSCRYRITREGSRVLRRARKLRRPSKREQLADYIADRGP